MTSVLTSIKKLFGVDEADTSFDVDLTLFINSALSKIKDTGAGKEGVTLRISSSDTNWTDLFINDDETVDMIQGCVFLIVKKKFDPPGTSFGMEAIDETIQEEMWRITSKVEERS